MRRLRRDEDLARGIQYGDRNCLAALVERHHSLLLGFLYRMTGGDRALAEDLVQETFVRVIHHISQYEYPRPFKAWLYRIATNLARDYYKQAEMRHTISMSEDVDAAVSDAPEDAVLLDIEGEVVASAMLRLPVPQRETLVLRYYQELSLAEIAEVQGVPVGTVKSRLSVGLGRLRELVLEREQN
ncbi:MAG TPA: RNA polymerase sigma factor [Phototrophicaceae bacterium]|nr:RNA polymerase sigma factor [Phototrophicaceae bacterium]